MKIVVKSIILKIHFKKKQTLNMFVCFKENPKIPILLELNLSSLFTRPYGDKIYLHLSSPSPSNLPVDSYYNYYYFCSLKSLLKARRTN